MRSTGNIIGTLGALVLLVFSCVPNPYARTNRVHKKQVKVMAKSLRQLPPAQHSPATSWVGTTNFSMRKPNFVIIHHTAQNSCAQTLRTFTLPRTQVSSHYVICKDGTVVQMLNDHLRGHHAGVSSWGHDRDLNSSSIGIELDNNGFEYFPEVQVQSLLQLLDTLKRRHAIPTGNFIGHGDIAPTRKNDPNWRFPWKTLSERGFGHWYPDTTGVEVPEHFDHLLALQVVGFGMGDSSAAILAFKRHWLQDTTLGMTPDARKILWRMVHP